MNKVCHITVHPMYDGRIFYRECCSLAKAGYEVHLVAVGGETGINGGVYVYSYPLVKNRFLRMLFMPWVALRLALKTKADVYHFHDPELIPVGLVLKFIKRAHVIYDVHEDRTLITTKEYIPVRLRKFVTKVIGALENFSAKRFDAVVTPTDPITNRLSVIALRAVTLRNFPTQEFIDSADKYLAASKTRDIDAIHIGTLCKERLDFLLTVALEVQRELGPKRWVFIGMPCDLMSYARLRVNDLGLKQVEIADRMPHIEIPKLICSSKLSVNFHKLGEAHTSVAIPVKIFEYLVCGSPVVSTSLPLVVELLGGVTSVKLVDDQLHNFVKAVIDFLKDPELPEKSMMACKCARKKYSWDIENGKLLELYDNILHKK